MKKLQIEIYNAWSEGETHKTMLEGGKHIKLSNANKNEFVDMHESENDIGDLCYY